MKAWIQSPYLGLYNAHPLLALKISRKKLVRVYNAHGLLKKSPSEMQELNINRIYFSVLWACFICWKNLRTIYLFSSSIKLQNIKCVGFYWRTCDFPVWERVKHIVPIYNAHPSYKLKNLGKILHINITLHTAIVKWCLW